VEKLTVSTADELREVLIEHEVPVESYGHGAAKTLGHLFEEIQLGECVLSIEDGKLVRRTTVLCLNIYKDEFVLVEDKQVFTADKRTRHRTLDASTGEKMKYGENPIETAQRLIEEEMPFAWGYPVTFKETRTRQKESLSYPGLATLYELHFCEVTIPENEIPDVVVVEADKTAFYR